MTPLGFCQPQTLSVTYIHHSLSLSFSSLWDRVRINHEQVQRPQVSSATQLQLPQKEGNVLLKTKRKNSISPEEWNINSFPLKNANYRNDESSTSKFQGFERQTLPHDCLSTLLACLRSLAGFNVIFWSTVSLVLYLFMFISPLSKRYFYCRLSWILHICISLTYIVQQTWKQQCCVLLPASCAHPDQRCVTLTSATQQWPSPIGGTRISNLQSGSLLAAFEF